MDQKSGNVDQAPSADAAAWQVRPGARYAKLGYVAINVTDVQRSRHFYETLLGMEVSGTGLGGEVFLRCSTDHHNMILCPGSRVGLRRLGWQMESDADLERMVEQLTHLGLAPKAVGSLELDALHQEASYRIVEPYTGTTMEYYARQKGAYSFTPSVAKIQRLGHVVLTTTRYEEAKRFFLDDLNFRLSDTIADRVSFMRCFPNRYHHSFGIADGSMNGLHHINFMVSEIDDVGKAIWRYANNDVPVVYGPGRHPPSNSVFIYASDPDGITVEYSYGMEEFPEEGARAARCLPLAQTSSDSWGGPPPRIKPVLVEMAEEMDLGAASVAIA